MRPRRPTARESLGIANRHLLVNVKRLHPLAGQRFLIEAMNEVIRTHPDTRLVICGTGPLLDELQAVARSAGVERHVTFAGLVDNAVVARYCAAADLFVLPSILEALPTVAVEALACGTPVISADNPGGFELNDVFDCDVSLVAREQPLPLAQAIVAFLTNKRRTSAETRELDRTPVPSRRRRQPISRPLRRRDREGRAVTQSAVRALAAALLAAFGGAIGLALAYGRSPALRIDFDVTPPRGIVDGVYPVEIDSEHRADVCVDG